MRLALIAVLFMLMAAPCMAYVSTYEINYNIGFDNVHQNIHVVFPESINRTLNFAFPGRINVLSVKDENSTVDYDVIPGANTTILIRETKSKEVFIELERFGAVWSSASFYRFIDDFRSAEEIGKLVVSATLPKGYIVHDGIFLPQGADIITDGERITLLWVETSVKSPGRIYSVEFVGTSDYNLVSAFAVVIIILIIMFVLFFRHHKKKTLREFKKGFSDDEIKVVDIISREKTIYQNKIEKELKFSRAKMTRITEKLKKKGLIGKKRYGRTNRLKWTG
jgi:uncharacterized membrane protein